MAKRQSHGKKGQVWVTDYTLSMLLFVAAALIAVKIIINSFTVNIAFDEMKSDASKISEMLLSEGFPEDWTNGSVIRPGLLDSDSRLSFTKVSNAMNLSLIPYNDMKLKLQTRYDFLVIFRRANGDIIEFNTNNTDCTIGSPADLIDRNSDDCLSPDFSDLDYDNLVKITRLAVYGSNITKMEVYVWN
jgi:hypothetical protein